MQITVRALHFRAAFMARECDWAFAVILFMWGLTLLILGDAYYQSVAAFRTFRAYIDYDTLGIILMTGGIIRLAMLFANGLWRPLHYARAWMALTTMMIWLVITMGFMSAGSPGVWIAFYPVFAVFDGVNVFRAMMDAAAAEVAARGRAEA